jgi:hypothetical protein
MASKPSDRIDRTGTESRGYQPQLSKPLPAQLKPPKGGSAIQAPKSAGNSK